MLDRNIAKNLIKENMPVVCSEDGQFAVVDHMEGTDVIKLARDKSGQHHYIPVAWVTAVDDKVHIDRPGDQAKKEWKTTPDDIKPDTSSDLEAERAASLPPPQVKNSVDATMGQPLVARVMSRKHELEAVLAGLPADHHSRADIDLALSNIDGLLTGDLSHVPAVVAADMNTWLERNKHLGESAVDPAKTDDKKDEPPIMSHA